MRTVSCSAGSWITAFACWLLTIGTEASETGSGSVLLGFGLLAVQVPA